MTSIEIFQWNDTYKTGISLIDEQHQQLVKLLNKLISHIAHQSSFTVLNAVYEELKNYTVYHFQTEESLWNQYFPDDLWELEHKVEHAHFIEKIVKLKAEEHQRPLDEVVAEIVSFLTHWLAFHILEKDKRLAKLVLEIKAGHSLEQAKIVAKEQMSGAAKVLIDTLLVMSDKLAQRTVQLTREIIQRKKLETALDEANRAKSDFLANMSHEIRTPISTITGMVYLMQQEGLSATQAEKLRKIDFSSKHLLSIVSDILDLSKIEAGKLELENRELSVTHLIDNVVIMLADRAKEKNLVVKIDTEGLAGMPEHFLGDPTRLQQCLLNYVNNAIKFTDSGSVTLRARYLEQSQDEVLLRFDVEDTGKGIVPEALDRLFTAFEQSDISTTRTHGGTGLGLAITKSLAQLMGGEVGVNSKPGAGSCFWFSARLKKVAQAALLEDCHSDEPADSVLLRDYAGASVLLVEDEPINREIAHMILERVGLVIDSAENGEDAIAKVQCKKYQLILMDMQMPVLNGLDATRRIRQLPQGAETPILAMTANAFLDDKQKCFAAGMVDFISKPIMPDELFKVLLKWLRKSQASSALKN